MTDHDVVEVRMHIAAKPETVFRFLSDPELVRQWLGDASLGAEIGDAITVRYPDGHAALGVLEERVPNERVVFSWGYDNAAHGVAPGSTRVSIDLQAASGGTMLTLRHAGLPNEIGRRAHRAGWRHYLSALANAAAVTKTHAEHATDAYFSAWAATDGDERARLLEQCWEADAVFRDAMGYAEGRDELAEYIAAARRFAPQIRLERTGTLATAHGFVSCRWRMVAPDGATVMSGSNTGELSADGRFKSIVGFWDPPTAAP